MCSQNNKNSNIYKRKKIVTSADEKNVWFSLVELFDSNRLFCIRCCTYIHINIHTLYLITQADVDLPKVN